MKFSGSEGIEQLIETFLGSEINYFRQILIVLNQFQNMGDHYPLPPSHSKSCYTCKKNFWFPTLQNNLDYILNYYQRIAPKGFSYWDIRVFVPLNSTLDAFSL